MAGDRKQFERALKAWLRLKRAGAFGTTDKVGCTAILTSPFSDEEPDTAAGVAELDAFRAEAIELAARIGAAGRRVELGIDASRSDLSAAIADPDVSSVYVIGNGSLSNLMLGERDYFDWRDVAASTTHLKLGDFVQRQCGGLTRNANVPLGLFAMSDPRRVFAAVGHGAFYPTSLDDEENAKIVQVFESERVDYETVVSLGRMAAPQAVT